jgi:chaperonin GroES
MLASAPRSPVTRHFAPALNIRPLGARVVVELDKAAEKVGNLIVPESAQQKVNQGTILAVGPGAYVKGKTIPVAVKIGQRVLLPAYGGQVVKLEGKEYTIVEENNLLGVFE